VEEGAKVYCSNCGASDIDGSSYCSSCGEPLSGAAAAPRQRRRLAGRGARLVTKIIDVILFGVAVAVIVISFAIDDGLGGLSLLTLLAIPIVQVVLLSKYGQTIGKKALDIRIVQASTEQNGGFVPNVLLRAWITFLLGIVPLFGIVDVLFIFREDRRCIHDMIAGTRVIQ
jgi:uncharacterized RDD family membrane protein YckC